MMTSANDARKAHKILDELLKRKPVLDEEREFLRRSLPELPKQKTLKEILVDVEGAARGVTDNYWSPSTNPQDWLWELHAQLKGIKDVPAIVPTLPAGMHLADHAVYGRVVVSPAVDDDGTCKIFYLSTHAGDGSDSCWAPIDSLTFVDAKPTHPEFLETEADYASAPAGTVAAKDGWLAWVKQKNGDWSCDGGTNGESELVQSGRRRVLRWGWSK